MEIEYHRKLKNACKDFTICKSGYGLEMAKKIHYRLEQARGVPNLELLRNVPGHWEMLREDRAGQFSTRLVEPMRFIFIPLNNPEDFIKNNQMNWSMITSIRFIEIVNYHSK